MKTHSISRRNAEDDTENYGKQQSDHGRIIVPTKIMSDEYPGPDSDTNNNCGYYWTDYTGDDDIMSQARNMLGKLGRHCTDELCSVIWCWKLRVYAQTGSSSIPLLRKKDVQVRKSNTQPQPRGARILRRRAGPGPRTEERKSENISIR